ncbi:hypothetical protein GQ43DRAFT_126954 [Delitschia confertaspora ATCC 74209]|uniref:Uncharacterized protein n=1 Tax=Delitschia confertaspora ATCC 74209 TaxID=1513339 RepID=A0A9P4JJC6_9PLEO|nr:hypothetical protein GQ43DRAFT_126954 [Delitschia confertaspora ATCC 74209]
MRGNRGLESPSQSKKPRKFIPRGCISSSTPSTISAPPKAAIASARSNKEELQRRQSPSEESVAQKPRRERRSSTLPGPEEEQDPDQMQESSQPIDRIAELEKAFAAALEDQNILREELEKARQRGNAYRDTLEGIRRQLSSSHSARSQFSSPSVTSRGGSEKGSEDKLQLGRERSTLLENNHELRERIAELQGRLVEQEMVFKERIQQERSSREADWNELTRRSHQSEKEGQERLQQLLDLKHSISTLTRAENQATDTELTDRMNQLYHRIREWVINNLRRSKLDFSSIERGSYAANLLESITPNYWRTDSTHKVALYQAIVTSNIMSLFNSPLLIGLPKTGTLATFSELATYIQDAGSEYREWVRITVRTLEKSQAKETLTQERETVLHQLSLLIRNQLQAISGVTLPLPAHSSLLAILQSVADLQHLLVLQKAEYKTHFFYANGRDMNFDSSSMESINDDEDGDGDTAEYRTVAFCVFPMLEKFGDETGEDMEVSNILMKAKVCSNVG